MRAVSKNIFIEDTEYWRELLEKRRKMVLSTDEILRQHKLSELSLSGTGEISSVHLYSADLMTDTQGMETLESLRERNIKDLQEIEEALLRLDKSTYGICENCQKSISIKRLETAPESRYCVDCA